MLSGTMKVKKSKTQQLDNMLHTVIHYSINIVVGQKAIFGNAMAGYSYVTSLTDFKTN